ncbi:MAG: transcription elongation factor [Nibricoccus sp.]
MDKALLRQATVDKLRADLENISRAAHMARDEATHEESKPENQYDMHAQEAAYLAEGQARLAAELQDSIAIFQGMALPAFAETTPIALGACVTIETAGRKQNYFIGPRNGGIEVEYDGAAFTVITPSSPLGKLLIGRRCGETISTTNGGRTISQRITAVK